MTHLCWEPSGRTVCLIRMTLVTVISILFLTMPVLVSASEGPNEGVDADQIEVNAIQEQNGELEQGENLIDETSSIVDEGLTPVMPGSLAHDKQVVEQDGPALILDGAGSTRAVEVSAGVQTQVANGEPAERKTLPQLLPETGISNESKSSWQILLLLGGGASLIAVGTLLRFSLRHDVTVIKNC